MKLATSLVAVSAYLFAIGLAVKYFGSVEAQKYGNRQLGGRPPSRLWSAALRDD
jgi:hypothetical protein